MNNYEIKYTPRNYATYEIPRVMQAYQKQEGNSGESQILNNVPTLRI